MNQSDTNDGFPSSPMNQEEFIIHMRGAASELAAFNIPALERLSISHDWLATGLEIGLLDLDEAKAKVDKMRAIENTAFRCKLDRLYYDA